MRLSLAHHARRAAVATAAILTATGVFVPFTSPAQAAAKEHVIVVAPPGTKNASDRGPGTFGRPLATLQEAQRRARQEAAKGDRDVAVHLRSGIYRLTEPLRFDAADSGRGGRTVTWRGYATLPSSVDPGRSPVGSSTTPRPASTRHTSAPASTPASCTSTELWHSAPGSGSPAPTSR